MRAPIKTGPIEHDHTRAVSDQGVMVFPSLQLKVYGLLAQGKSLDPDLLAQAQTFVREEVLAKVESIGDSNQLGFLVLHPGDLGVSISAHWWVQGSVLCQHIRRQLYDAAHPMDTATRPVIGCVWELEIIAAEQAAWRATMMSDHPDPTAYLTNRITADVV